MLLLIPLLVGILGQYCLKPYRDMNPCMNSLQPLNVVNDVVSIQMYVLFLFHSCLGHQSKYSNTVFYIDLYMYFTPVLKGTSLSTVILSPLLICTSHLFRVPDKASSRLLSILISNSNMAITLLITRYTLMWQWLCNIYGIIVSYQYGAYCLSSLNKMSSFCFENL